MKVTVEKLIKELAQYPKDLIVVAWDADKKGPTDEIEIHEKSTTLWDNRWIERALRIHVGGR